MYNKTNPIDSFFKNNSSALIFILVGLLFVGIGIAVALGAFNEV